LPPEKTPPDKKRGRSEKANSPMDKGFPVKTCYFNQRITARRALLSTVFSVQEFPQKFGYIGSIR